MPFQSQSQRRFLFATNPSVAREFAAATPKGAKLPEKVTKKKLTKAAALAGLARLVKRAEPVTIGSPMSSAVSKPSGHNLSGMLPNKPLGSSGLPKLETPPKSPLTASAAPKLQLPATPKLPPVTPPSSPFDGAINHMKGLANPASQFLSRAGNAETWKQMVPQVMQHLGPLAGRFAGLPGVMAMMDQVGNGGKNLRTIFGDKIDSALSGIQDAPEEAPAVTPPAAPAPSTAPPPAAPTASAPPPAPAPAPAPAATPLATSLAPAAPEAGEEPVAEEPVPDVGTYTNTGDKAESGTGIGTFLSHPAFNPIKGPLVSKLPGGGGWIGRNALGRLGPAAYVLGQGIEGAAQSKEQAIAKLDQLHPPNEPITAGNTVNGMYESFKHLGASTGSAVEGLADAGKQYDSASASTIEGAANARARAEQRLAELDAQAANPATPLTPGDQAVHSRLQEQMKTQPAEAFGNDDSVWGKINALWGGDKSRQQKYQETLGAKKQELLQQATEKKQLDSLATVRDPATLAATVGSILAPAGGTSFVDPEKIQRAVQTVEALPPGPAQDAAKGSIGIALQRNQADGQATTARLAETAVTGEAKARATQEFERQLIGRPDLRSDPAGMQALMAKLEAEAAASVRQEKARPSRDALLQKR